MERNYDEEIAELTIQIVLLRDELTKVKNRDTLTTKRVVKIENRLDFLRTSRKRFETSSQRSDAQFERQKKIWEAREKTYDPDLEKEKHDAFIKDMRKTVKQQKALVEKVERIMRQSKSRQPSKAKKYKSPSGKSALVTEQIEKYKNKKK